MLRFKKTNKKKHIKNNMKIIINLIKKFPNDFDLGKEIRKFVNKKLNKL